MKKKLNHLMIALLLLLPSFSSRGGAPNGFYIKLGEATTKRVDLLLQTPHSTTQPPNHVFLGEFYRTLLNDLTVSSMFNIFETNYLGVPELSLNIRYEVKGDTVVIDAKAFKKNGLFAIYGEQIKGPISQGRKIAHTLSNNLLKQLTGTSGPFLTKFVAATDRAGGPAKEIYYFDWDGANAVKISNHRNIARSPTWSADGSKIAYTAYVLLNKKSFPTPEVILYDPALSRLKLLTARPGNNSGASFSPDGNSIFLTSSSEGNNDIYKISAETGRVLTKLTNGPLGAMNVEAAVSPNGRQIAFSSDRSANTAIYVMNTDGTGLRRLTQFKEFANTPSWSPDGTKFLLPGRILETLIFL